MQQRTGQCFGIYIFLKVQPRLQHEGDKKHDFKQFKKCALSHAKQDRYLCVCLKIIFDNNATKKGKIQEFKYY